MHEQHTMLSALRNGVVQCSTALNCGTALHAVQHCNAVQQCSKAQLVGQCGTKQGSKPCYVELQLKVFTTQLILMHRTASVHMHV